jgi:hypothetical protein
MRYSDYENRDRQVVELYQKTLCEASYLPSVCDCLTEFCLLSLG